jgi:hypothetical protein
MFLLLRFNSIDRTLIRRKLKTEILSLGQHLTALQRAKLLEKLNSLHRKIMSWFEIQAVYIPGVALLRAHAMKHSSSNTPEIPVYKTVIWLPSSIGHQTSWDLRLGEYEWQLRQAQARDALDSLRRHLRLRDFLIKKKKDWARGVSKIRDLKR